MHITERLNSKVKKATELTRSLDKSLALEYLWPEAFDHGRARSHWFGPAGTNARNPGRAVHLLHEFIIHDDEGNTRSFSYEEVPDILGGGLKEEMYRRVTNITKT